MERFKYQKNNNPGPGEYDVPGGINDKGTQYIS